MEDEIKEITPVSLEEFEEKIKDVAANNRKQMLENFKKGTLYLMNFTGVSKYKSIRRAIKRGHVSMFGDVYPKRPFNNRKTVESRIKRQIYGEIKRGNI